MNFGGPLLQFRNPSRNRWSWDSRALLSRGAELTLGVFGFIVAVASFLLLAA